LQQRGCFPFGETTEPIVKQVRTEKSLFAREGGFPVSSPELAEKGIIWERKTRNGRKLLK
jgi:hypothetical protein